VPTAADSARALSKLSSDLAALITLPEELKAGRVGIDIRSLTRNRGIYSLNADKPLTPASTTKVVTTFTALSELGPDYMIRTVVGMTNRPKNGVLVGDLYVKGHGDPYLSIGDIDALVDQTVASGIVEVSGNIVGDGTWFDGKTERIEYSGDEDVVEDLPPITALSVENSAFSVIVSSPRTPGEPLNVQTYPRSSGFVIVNAGVTAAGRTPARKGKKGSGRQSQVLAPSPSLLRDDLDPGIPRYGDEPALAQTLPRNGGTAPEATNIVGPPKPALPTGPLKVQVTNGKDGEQTITVSGTLAANRTVNYHYEMENPALVVAGMICDRLRLRGIRIGGHATSGATPSKYKVVAETKRPLVEVLANVMKHSNNYLAEYVFKMIGAAAGGREETAKRSVEKIGQRMSIVGVNFNRCLINDGSGLSRANCLSAEALAEILSAAYHDRKLFRSFYELLSIAGVDGTLRKRMKGTFAENNLRGKTGTLRNVAALTAYVTTRDGELMVFGSIMNGANIGSYRQVQDRIGARLAAFSYSQGMAPVAPPAKAPAKLPTKAPAKPPVKR
jgi:D-alanyl-D-alanine carboxypeptidase/D-alanyl-D-alanine-endopeptidase (penicillin-binding protein 4)